MTTLALAPLLLGSFSAIPGPAALQAATEPAAEPRQQQDSTHILSMGLSDAAAWLSHPKDAALLNAFTMLDERLSELPEELGGDMPPPLAVAMQPESIGTLLRLLRAQKRMTLMAAPPELQQQGQPFAFGLSIDERDEAAAAAYHGELIDLLTRMEAPFPPQMIQLHGKSLDIEMGASARPMGSTEAAAMLGEGTLTMEMQIDFGGYLNFLGMLMAQSMGPDELTMMFDIFDRMGLSEMTVDMASANAGTVARTVSITSGIGGKMKAAGMLPDEGVTAAQLAPVPADATMVSVQRLDLEAVFDATNALVSEIMQEQGGGGDVAEMIRSTMGIDLRTGVFGAMGDTLGFYASETTGGGGAASTVMFASVRDVDALLDTKEQIVEILNSLAEGNMNGYANVRTWTRADVEYSTLMFPGLPIPFEPTIAFSEKWAVAAATPQAALAAMGQIESGTPGFGADPRVAALIAGGKKNAFSYMDTAHYARSGYGTTSMLMSAIGNAVRSRVDGLRDPGPIMPVYAEFAAGIVPTFGTTELVGDKLVTFQTTDSSTVVQLAMLTGFLYEYAGAFVIPALAAASPQLVRELNGGY